VREPARQPQLRIEDDRTFDRDLGPQTRDAVIRFGQGGEVRLDTSGKPYDLYDSEGLMHWLILGSDGGVTAQFSLPVTLEVLAFRDCKIYGRTQLKDGTPVLQRFLTPGCT
jgi:hypothetical protein